MTEVQKAIEIRAFRKRFALVELERILSADFRGVYRRVEAVTDVTLSVDHGQVYGFLGPNGAGKTTTIKACMDLIRPTSGSIRLYGMAPGDPAVKHRIGYLPEHPYFYDYLKPQEILDFYGRLFEIPWRERRARIDKLLDRVGLGNARNRALRKFSKGMLQRLGIAQALLNDPDLLVLDEPMSGLDPMGRKDIRDLIIEERDKGKTVFFSTHILSDVEFLCDRVAIVVGGTVRREGMLTDLLATEEQQTEVVVRGLTTEAEVAVVDAGGAVSSLGNSKRVLVSRAEVGRVLETLVRVGASVERLQANRESLETLFMREAEQGGSRVRAEG